MLAFFTNNRKNALIAAVFLTVIFSIGLRLIPLHEINQQQSIFFYKNKPILTTYDGYFYLKVTKQFLKRYLASTSSRKKVDVFISQLKTHRGLSLITALICNISGASLEWTAFFLPVILSSCLIIVFFLWSQAYRNFSVFLISGIAGTGNLAWYSRSCLGWFDTDSLIPFFMFIVPFFSYKFSLASDIKEKIKFGLLTALFALLFCYWWHRALFFVPILIAIPYILSLFFIQSSFVGKLSRLFLILVFLSIFVLAVSGQNLEWLGSFGKQLASVSRTFIGLAHPIVGLYPSMVPGISEYSGLSIIDSIEKVSGHWFVFICSVFGLVMAFREKRDALLFLICPIGIGLSGFFIRRCLIFLAPVMAFGLGFFIYNSYRYSERFLGRYVRAICTILGMILLVILVLPSFNMKLTPVFNPQEMAVADKLKQYPSSGYVWCWWDYGYLLEYVAEKRVFVNGSTQKPRRVFLSAVPFASEDSLFSANWIRFFSLRGPGGLSRMARKVGSEKKALAFLKEVFRLSEPLNDIIKKYGLSSKNNWKDFLFPRGKVYVFIPYRMIDLAAWWYSFGTYSFGTNKKYVPYYKFIDGVVKLNKEKGTLQVGSRQIVLNELDLFTLEPIPHLDVLGKYNRNISDLSLIFNVSAHKAVILDKELKKTTCVKLLFNPYGSESFKPIDFRPFQAGLWEVLMPSSI